MSGKLILHIGTHKTGTTTLQNVLSSNAEFLESYGFYYPTMPEKWPRASANRNGYWLDMAAWNEVAGIEQEDAEKIEPCRQLVETMLRSEEKTMILSDERLWYNGCKEGFWEHVHNTLSHAGAQEITVILYLRRQDLFAESLWMQYVKMPARTKTTLWEFANKKRNRDACDYARGIRRLQSVFGQDKVIVRVYDKSCLVCGDTVADFLDVLGISDSAYNRPEDDCNYSLTPSVALLKLAINRSEEYCEQEDFLAPFARSMSEQSPERGSFFEPEQRKELLGRYAEGNEWIARTVLGREDGILFNASVEELNRPAYSPDPIDLVMQGCTLMASALASERAAHAKEVEALTERIKYLERVNRNSLVLKLERLVQGQRMRR